jgi:hypothetical protein
VSFLLDTNVVSEIRKRAPDAGVSGWFASVPADKLFLSVLVVGEIGQDVERLSRRDPAQAEVFEHWLARLADSFGDRIVPVTARVAERWGRLNVPDPVPVVDGLMAATALSSRASPGRKDGSTKSASQAAAHSVQKDRSL